MEADLVLLPKRPSNQPSKFQKAHKTSFMTNFYEVQIKETKSIIYQYSMEVDLPSDSS